jgi:VanZ family protein
MNQRDNAPSDSSFIFHPSSLLWYWLPLALWLAAIFYFSTDAMSAKHTSRFLEPLIRSLLPWASYPTVVGVHMGIRKLGHVTEYALLTVLAFRAVRGGRTAPNWTPSWAAVAFAIAVAYAAIDELHQGFVSTRSASVFDVLTDASGALGAVAVISWGLAPRGKNLVTERGSDR